MLISDWSSDVGSSDLHAVVRMAEAIDAALEANGLTPGDVDWLVPHQANIRIIESMGRRLNLPSDRVVVTVERHANTSAASIPLALAEAVGDGRIQQGDLILMEIGRASCRERVCQYV